MIKSIFSLNILFFIIITSIARLFLSTLPSFEYDESAYRAWSARLVEKGPSSFYSSETFTNNPLGGLYGFYFIGLVKTAFLPDLSFFSKDFDLLLKIPANIADITTGFIIYLLIKKKLDEKWALISFLMYVLNPALLFNSSIWGQYDGLATLFLLLSTYLLLIKKNPELSIASFATAWTIKPQALAFAPILLLFMLITYKPFRWLTSSFSFLLTVILIYLPFFPSDPIKGLVYVNQNSTTLFNCTTCFAFNFWGVFGNWQQDSQKFLEIPLFAWGMILLFLFLSIIFFSKPFSQKLKLPYFYLTTATSIMTFFTLLTRMHERYLFPFFAFLLLAALMLRSKTLIFFYIFVSGVHFINLLLPYLYYNHLLTPLADHLVTKFSLFSLILVLSFLFLFKKLLNLKNEKI